MERMMGAQKYLTYINHVESESNSSNLIPPQSKYDFNANQFIVYESVNGKNLIKKSNLVAI